jgi:glycosyltransferase involved in cell wall biosynthesis
MKIAVVYHFYAHYRGPIIEELRGSDKYEFVFISGEEVSSSYSTLKLFNFGGATDYIRLQNLWFFKHFLWQKGLSGRLSQGKFDAVIFLGDWKFVSTWVASGMLKLKGIPTLFWSHGLRSTGDSLNEKLKLTFLKSFSHGGFVYDSYARDLMQRKGFQKDLSVIYNSLDYVYQQQVLQSVQDETVALPERPYVVFSGRIEPRKRLDQLIRAIHLLKEANVEVDAVVIGDGPSKSDLIALSQQLGVEENIAFTGSCYDERILCEYFYNAVACIVPSAVGLTAIHALTYRTPVITNDDFESHGPEIEAVKEGVSGFFYKKDNESALAEVIRHVLSLSPLQLSEIKSNCEKIIRAHFTPERQREVIESHLSSVLNG